LELDKKEGGKMKNNFTLIIAVAFIVVLMSYFCAEINSLKEENEALKQLLFQKDTVTTEPIFFNSPEDSISLTYTYDAR
jgi:hypothetical protein